MSINLMVEYKWLWTNVRSIAAYRRTQKSSLHLGLRIVCLVALADFHFEDPSELVKCDFDHGIRMMQQHSSMDYAVWKKNDVVLAKICYYYCCKCVL